MLAMNLQQQVHSKIQKGLETTQKTLMAPLLFGHLCKGDLEKPGVFRVSAVVGKQAKEVFPGINNPCDHDTAFLRHVQCFGREKTLLNWLVCWTRGKMKDYDCTEEQVSFAASFLIGKGNGLVRHKSDITSVSVVLNSELLESLAPSQLADNYLNVLYQCDEEYKQTNESSGYCGHRLDELGLLAAQHHTLRAIKQCTDSAKAFSELCATYDHTSLPDDFLMLRLLSALQIAFFYARVFDKKCLAKEGGFVSISCPHGDSFKNLKKNEWETVPIFAVSMSVANEMIAIRHMKILKELPTKNPIAAAVGLLTHSGDTATGIGQTVCAKTGFASDLVSQLYNSITKHVPNPPFEAWCENAAAWMAHLVSSLRGARHEGGPLEFTFVMGDMAQIEDSPAFELVHLADESVKFPPSGARIDEKAMLASLDKAMRTIEKENYFWFQGGRYALLWDFTSPEQEPRYLLGLKDSSWHVFIANARNRRPSESAKAALVVGYLDDRGGGGIIVNREHEFTISKDGEWLQRGGQLTDRIGTYLKAAGTGILADDERKTLVEALVAVSNDPDTGCMLVLANGTNIPNFETMGHPWKATRLTSSIKESAESEKSYQLLELPMPELVALLGMDGAACVWKQDSKCRIAFRRLASPDGAKKAAYRRKRCVIIFQAKARANGARFSPHAGRT